MGCQDKLLPDIASLLPHSGPMILLDRVLAADTVQLQAEVRISPASLFWQDGAVGSWIGIEYMAQAIAAWAGFQALGRGEAAKIGFLLGARRYECLSAGFTDGQCLLVTVQLLLQADNGLGSFDCSITDAQTGQALAQATVSVFQPDDARIYLEGSTP